MSFAGFMDFARKDVNLLNSSPTVFLKKLHSDFIYKYEKDRDSYEYAMSESLRLSGIYWCLSAMDIMQELDRMNRDEIMKYVRECRREDGGYGPAEQHDSHLLHTLCAVQIAIILDRLECIDAEGIVQFIKNLQKPDGSFTGDSSNEIDTRFTFVSLATLYLLGRLNEIDTEKAVEFVLKCYNNDGGFGTRPDSESHSGQVYCCVGSLCILDRLESIDRNKTAAWLAQRQCTSGGLNGRPEKLPDVCYSWWVLSSLAMLKRLHWIDEEKMKRFIYACQDSETGGFADRPEDVSDPFHTVFGIAALSLFNHPELSSVDAVFCMTKKCLGDKSLC